MITLIDYGSGNLASLEGALAKLGLAFRRAEKPGEAVPEGPLILPSGGHFEAAAAALRKQGWWSEIPQAIAMGRPLLGVGIGMQLLAEGSEECPKGSGLGLLPGIVRRLGPGVKVPHMGWSRVHQEKVHPALPDPKDGWLYFSHSYALEPNSETIYSAQHGRSFAAVEARGRILGFQPRPDRSGTFGLLLLQRVLAWMGEGKGS